MKDLTHNFPDVNIPGKLRGQHERGCISDDRRVSPMSVEAKS
jgi:hypothetical protein